MTPRDIGRQLEAARKAAGFSQRAAAALLHVQPSQLAREERGELSLARLLERLAFYGATLVVTPPPPPAPPA